MLNSSMAVSCNNDKEPATNGVHACSSGTLNKAGKPHSFAPLRERHLVSSSAPGAVYTVDDAFALQALSKLTTRAGLEQHGLPLLHSPKAPLASNQLGAIAANLNRSMPRYNGPHLAHIANQYRQIGLFDPAVFERISLEVKSGGSSLALQARDLRAILQSAADLRADVYLEPKRLQQFIEPLVTASRRILAEASTPQSAKLMPIKDAAEIARALATLSPNDAPTFALWVMWRCSNNPAADTGSTLWQSLAATATQHEEIALSRAFKAAQRLEASTPKKLSVEEQKALETLANELTDLDYSCRVVHSAIVGGVPVAALLCITDQNSSTEYHVAIHMPAANARYVTNVKGEKQLCGEEFIKERVFAQGAKLTTLHLVTDPVQMPLLYSLPASLRAPLGQGWAGRATKQAVNQVLNAFAELFQGAEQAAANRITHLTKPAAQFRSASAG